MRLSAGFIKIEIIISFIVFFLGGYTNSFADATLKLSDTSSVSIGAWTRLSFTHIDNPPAGAYDNKFNVDSARLKLSAKINKSLGLLFATERDPAGGISILDSAIQLNVSPAVNLWAGRFVTPVDRANLTGSYFLNTWAYPFVSAYPTLLGGRNDGVVVWGQPTSKLTYYLGTYQGLDAAGGPNATGRNLMYSGRVAYDFWGAEPGYFTQSTYYGSQDVFAIGLAGAEQKDSVGTIGAPGTFTGWNADFLLEKNLGAITPSAEGAYYEYSYDHKLPSAEGSAYFLYLGFLINHEIGIGKLQPHVRYQRFNADTGLDHKRLDLGVNYVIDGHKNRISAVLSRDDTGVVRSNLFTLGYQLIF